MDNTIKENIKYALKWGFIIGIADMIFFYFTFIVYSEIRGQFFWGITWFMIKIIYLIIIVIQRRKKHNNIMNFNDAFIICLVICVTDIALMDIFNYLLFNIIDPNLNDLLKQKEIESMNSFIGKINGSQEIKDKITEKIQREENLGSPIVIIKSFIKQIIAWSIPSIILARILKREPKYTL